MTQTTQKQRFVDDSKRIGPAKFLILKYGGYGPDYGMPTMPELISLVDDSLQNKSHEKAKEVIRTLNYRFLPSDTGILYVPKGMFVQDEPNIKIESRRIYMDKRTLEAQLGKHEEKGVFFSDDRKLRFVPYGFCIGPQSASKLSQNPGVIATVGGEESAAKLAEVSDYYDSDPQFLALSNVDSPKVRIAGMYSVGFDGSLNVVANGSEVNKNGFSFGVKKNYTN